MTNYNDGKWHGWNGVEVSSQTTEDLVIEIATKLLIERVRHNGHTHDTAFAAQCVVLAKTIIKCAKGLR